MQKKWHVQSYEGERHLQGVLKERHPSRCWRFRIPGGQMAVRRYSEIMLACWQSQIAMVLLCYGE